MFGNAGESVMKLTNGGWIVGTVVDFDREHFYVVGVSKTHKARKLFDVDRDDVTAVPHRHIVEFRTNVDSSSEVTK